MTFARVSLLQIFLATDQYLPYSCTGNTKASEKKAWLQKLVTATCRVNHKIKSWQIIVGLQ